VPFGVLTIMTFESLAEDTTGITDAKNSLITFFGINAISSIIQIEHENPRDADDDVANALIVDLLAKVISYLL